jgi:hypothetical protein
MRSGLEIWILENPDLLALYLTWRQADRLK